MIKVKHWVIGAGLIGASVLAGTQSEILLRPDKPNDLNTPAETATSTNTPAPTPTVKPVKKSAIGTIAPTPTQAPIPTQGTAPATHTVVNLPVYTPSPTYPPCTVCYQLSGCNTYYYTTPEDCTKLQESTSKTPQPVATIPAPTPNTSQDDCIAEAKASYSDLVNGCYVKYPDGSAQKQCVIGVQSIVNSRIAACGG